MATGQKGAGPCRGD